MTVNTTGNIGNILGTSLSRSGITGSKFDANGLASGIGTITGTVAGSTYNTTPYGDAGIWDVSVISGTGGVGQITGSSNGVATGSGISLFTVNTTGNVAGLSGTANHGTGIKGTTVNAGSVGAISGIANDNGSGPAEGDGIFNLQVVASTGGITSITGTTASTDFYSGINDSIFRAAGNIGPISGVTGSTAAAGINLSGFDAQNSIGTVSSTGDIKSSIFVAGVNLGANFSVAGAGADLTTTGGASAGFDTPATVGVNADTAGVGGNIGAITLTQIGGLAGKLTNSSFIAGITSLGNDLILNVPALPVANPNHDTFLAGSTVGAIIAPGGIDPVFITGGSVGAITVSAGQINGTTVIANDTTGSGIGDINVTYTIPNGANDTTNDAINGSTFTSAASIGKITATLNGTATTGFLNDNAALDTVNFNAQTSIGDITATNNASGALGGSWTQGIVYVNVNAGLGGGAGGIGTITVQVSPADTTYGTSGSTVFLSNFNAAAGVGSTGGIVGINITDTRGPSTPDYADVEKVNFNANGSIGAVTTTGLFGSTINATGSIGNITVNGDMGNFFSHFSSITAGIDISSVNVQGNVHDNSLISAGGSINGTVTVANSLYNSSTISAGGNITGLISVGTNIANSTVSAGGSLSGGLTVGVNVTASDILAAGNIGAITVSGNVDTSKFIAGYATGNADVAGKSIGAVNISGWFTSSDLIASVAYGADGHYGSADDVSNSGTIASVSIGSYGSGGVEAPIGLFAAVNGIEAHTFTNPVVAMPTLPSINVSINGPLVGDNGSVFALNNSPTWIRVMQF